MNPFPGTQWLLPQLLPDISIKHLRLSISKILQLATFVDLQPAGGDQAPDRRETAPVSHTPNTETGGKSRSDHQTRGKANANMKVESSPVIASCFQFTKRWMG